MNKNVKTLLSILMIALTLVTFTTSVFAYSPIEVEVKEMENDQVKNTGGQVLGIIKVVGIILSVGVLMVIGIKYMMGSAQEKAEYKKTMIPYLIGAVLIFGASTIANMVFNFATGI